MTYPKLLALVTFLLFALIGVLALMKGDRTVAATSTLSSSSSTAARGSHPLPSIPIELGQQVQEVIPAPQVEKIAERKPLMPRNATGTAPILAEVELRLEPPADTDRIDLLFNRVNPKFPFVETIVYKSRAAWQKGRPAWLSDYAGYYSTSRHFIARSLNGRPDYFKQDIAEGDRFNVLRKDLDLSFMLIVDKQRCKLWLYAYDRGLQERYLLKTYRVGLGRDDHQRTSGSLTPFGKYGLGSKIAIYKPQMKGYYNGKKVEMMRIFGTRWIPFEKEINDCTAPAKGLGIHGVPWTPSAEAGELVEAIDSIGKYESDGCIRLATADMEELFAIIITKPATIEIVADFNEVALPGTEWNGSSTPLKPL